VSEVIVLEERLKKALVVRSFYVLAHQNPLVILIQLFYTEFKVTQTKSG